MQIETKHTAIESELISSKEGGVNRIDPLFNEAFIRIFGQESSRGITRNLINCIFSKVGVEPIGAIDTISAEHTSAEGSVECKSSRFDVRLLSSNRAIDLEAQCYPEDIENRSLFYASQLMVANTRKGLKSYKDIPQVVVVTLLNDAPMFPESEEFVKLCRFNWNGEGPVKDLASSKMLFIVVELDKVRKRYTELTEEVLGDSLLSWSYLLVRGYQDKGEVDSIVNKYPSIEEFAELYGFALGDLEVVRAYENFQSAQLEYQSRQDYLARMEREARDKGIKEGFEEGREEGLVKGREEGIEAGRKEGIEAGRKEGIEAGRKEGVEKSMETVARNLLEQGVLDLSQISEVTGLPVDKLETLAASPTEEAD